MIMEYIRLIIGDDDGGVNWWQMCIRGVIVFLVAIFMLKISNKRIFGKHSAFDIVLGIILGSILSRAITGNSPFFPTIFTGFVMVFMHRFMAVITFKTDSMGKFFKGKPSVLVENGEILWENMKKNNISRNDLIEAMHIRGQVTDLNKIREAHIERNGDISIILYDK